MSFVAYLSYFIDIRSQCKNSSHLPNASHSQVAVRPDTPYHASVREPQPTHAGECWCSVRC